MKRRERGIRIALAALMLLFIWGHSMMPASVSGRESEWVRELLEPLLALLQRGFFHLGLELEPSTLVRKLAHFTIFAVLGFLCFAAFSVDLPPRRAFPAALTLGAVRAVLDEVHQSFVPGRSCELRDMGIDGAGVLLGAAFLLLILYWIQRKKLKK